RKKFYRYVIAPPAVEVVWFHLEQGTPRAEINVRFSEQQQTLRPHPLLTQSGYRASCIGAPSKVVLI
ncbi:MAG: hypothetical protein WAK97_17665, partial [Pseudolabrys sp.]